jgi:CDP-glucose 4,6-dehydratase
MPDGTQHPHEAGQLRLDITQARGELGWRPRWALADALRATVEWDQAWRRGEDVAALTRGQIHHYLEAGA